LLDSDYLSLAEVQVMGVDPLRFAEVDVSNTRNNFGGFNNVPNFPNDFFGIGCNMKVLLISVGAEVCFIRNTNLVVA
jgi:hypothetical protein